MRTWYAAVKTSTRCQGLPVSHTEFDPAAGRLIFHTTADGDKRAVGEDLWEKFVHDEKARRQQNRPH